MSHPEGVYDFYPIIPRKPGILKLLLLVGELKNCKYVLKDYYPLYRILNAMLKPNTVHCSERFNLTLTPGI